MTTTLTLPTRADSITPRLCSTCRTPMDEVRPNVYVCPVARTEARLIPDALRERGRELAAARIDGCDF